MYEKKPTERQKHPQKQNSRAEIAPFPDFLVRIRNSLPLLIVYCAKERVLWYTLKENVYILP